MPPVILSIAGYDPSSGAGVTADVKTAAANGCYAATCITALTVQSTEGVFAVQAVSADLIRRTLKALADDLEIAAVHLGMLGSDETAYVVADFLGSLHLPNIVLDPVIRSSSGAALLDEAGLEVMRTRFIPLCNAMTPNIHEAAILTGAEPLSETTAWEAALPRIREMAENLHKLGSRAVVITGGHLDPPNDYLSSMVPLQELIIDGKRVESRSTHGTGCAYATALACYLALGEGLPQAARQAKEYVSRAIRAAYPIGKGIGPLNHFP
jgi:hydroxymethylpyrimidine/phosphomethylpyrimidine kinase